MRTFSYLNGVKQEKYACYQNHRRKQRCILNVVLNDWLYSNSLPTLLFRKLFFDQTDALRIILWIALDLTLSKEAKLRAMDHIYIYR